MRYLDASPLMDGAYLAPINLPFHKYYKQDYKQTQLECYAWTKRCENITKQEIIIFNLIYAEVNLNPYAVWKNLSLP